MVGIQVLLVLAVLFVIYKFFSDPYSYQIRAWIKILTIVFTLTAIVAIIFPNSANTAAHWVGVGRGADLLLYMLVVAFIFTVLNLYIKSKKDQKNLTAIARKLALLETELKRKNSD